MKTEPTAVSKPELVRLNEGLAGELGLDVDWLKSAEGVAMLSGNGMPEGAEPLAQAYAGHQFGGWSPQLGDGRAILLGEVLDRGGVRRDLQLKGSGRTAFSRGGDGRATLGSVVREYLVSEAMVGLGVPATRALAVVATGDRVPRQEFHPGGILTRVAASHLRVGTFQYFFAQSDFDALRELADYAIARHYPEAAEAESPYLTLFENIALAQASLIAKWMSLGFIHGVMNTDNMAISGETIDFGPCAFVDVFHPAKVFSSIDRHGRYAWANQPNAGHWNLERLGDAFAPLIADDMETAKALVGEVLEKYLAAFKEAFYGAFVAKLGIETLGDEEIDFVTATLEMMAERELDFTVFFRQLTLAAEGGEAPDCPAEWLERWQRFSGGERVPLMRSNNPVFIPRNHRVEEAIVAAEAGDFAPFHELAEALRDPFVENSKYEEPPTEDEVVCETFCGT